MPMTLEAPVLQVDANVIHKVDTTNPANLFSMWTGEFGNFTSASAHDANEMSCQFSQGVVTQSLRAGGSRI